MSLLLLLKGLIIGFAIAAPVGPIGVLCIQCSLHNGFKIELMTVLILENPLLLEDGFTV